MPSVTAAPAGGVGRYIDVGGAMYNAGGFGVDLSGASDATVALQALFDQVGAAGGGDIVIPGFPKITASMRLNYPGSCIKIRGIGRTKSGLTQATNNIPVIAAISNDVWGVTLEDLCLTYAAAQPAANTGAVALQFGGVGTPGGASFFHWSVHRMQITKAQMGIGFGAAPYTVWNSEFNDILLQQISQSLVVLLGSAGQPVNNFTQIKHLNAGVPIGAGTAFAVGEMEAQVSGLDIEDWANALVYVAGGSPVSIRGCHVERWTSTVGTGFLVADGSLTIADVSVAGTPDGGSGLYLFKTGNAGATLDLRHLVNYLTISNVVNYRTLNAAAGSAVYLRDINEATATAHTFALGTTSLAAIRQWDGVLGAQSAAAPALATAGTIATAATAVSRVAPAGAVTGVILAAGTVAGQTVTVVNEAVAGNSVTFDVAGTSHVADGAASPIPGLTARSFVWDSVTALWYRSA